jgi:hypothetical protein
MAVLLVSGVGIWLGRPPAAYGAVLDHRALQVVNNEAGVTTQYELSFDLMTAGVLGSVDVQFCANDPLPGTPCVAPVGLDVSAAVMSQQLAGPGDFAIDTTNSTANDLLLTRTPSNVGAQPVSLDFTGVVNPSAPGAYYVRLQTFAAADGTGTAIDYGGIAFDITNQLAINAEVPPYLIFCTGITIPNLNCSEAQGDFLDFGLLTPAHADSGTSQLLVATNAGDGYSVTVTGTTLTSGNNTIVSLTTNDVSRPGTAQFGFNLRANAAPSVGSNPSGPGVGAPSSNYNQPDSYRFADGDIIIANSVPDDVRLYTASYIANVPPTQAAGVYVSTLTYVCLAEF